jgi:hypothetical protein
MDRPRSAIETATPMEALEIIRRMAVRHGDDQIASVLNRLGSTGKGNRWNQNRVAAARKNHSITGPKRALPNPEKVSLNEAARLCGVSHRSIERLVEAGLLNREQVAARAPWEIRRSDLEAEPVRSILDQLRRTGKLVLGGGARKTNLSCSLKINQMIMPGIMNEGADGGSACLSPIIHPVPKSRSDTLITMMKAAEFCDFDDRPMLHNRTLDRALLLEPKMRTRLMAARDSEAP